MPYFYKHVNGKDAIIFNDCGNNTYIGNESSKLMLKIQKLVRSNKLNMLNDYNTALRLYLTKAEGVLWTKINEQDLFNN